MHFFVFFCVSLCSGIRVAMVNNRNEQPSKATAYVVDTEAKTATPFTKDLDGANVYVSGSCICNGTYYAIQTDVPMSWGMVAVNMLTGVVTELDTPQLFHAIWCDPTNPGKLLGIASGPPPPFSFVRYDISSMQTEQILEFPTKDWGEYDNLFTFVEKANEIWAGFPKNKIIGGGELYIIDVSTGKIKGSYNFSRDLEEDIPYVMFPGNGGSSNSSFTGVMMKGPLTSDIHFAHLSLDKDRVKINIAQKVSWFFSSSMPDKLCSDGNVYTMTEQNHLVGMNPKTGKQVLDLDMASIIDVKNKVGGAACF